MGKAQQLLKCITDAEALRQTRELVDTLRDRYVMPDGSMHAPVALVGGGPNEGDEQCALSFSGPTGNLLRSALAQAERGSCLVYMTNVVKFRPVIESAKGRPEQTGDRQPSSFEFFSFTPLIKEELEIVAPKIIVTLGAGALEALTGSPMALSDTRGRTLECKAGSLSIPLLASTHPSDAHRGQGNLDPAFWRLVDDLKRAFQFTSQPTKEGV